MNAICIDVPPSMVGRNTLGKAYPVVAVNPILEEFETVSDQGDRCTHKMRRYDLEDGSEWPETHEEASARGFATWQEPWRPKSDWRAEP